jgi:peptide/nickel transport system permease protein
VQAAQVTTRRRRQRLPLSLQAGGAVFAVVALAAAAAPLIAPFDPQTIDLPSALAIPNSHHLAGADALGRDVLSRLLYGGRYSLLIAGFGMVGSVTVGTIIGLISAFGGRQLEFVVLRLIDLQLAFPFIMLAIAVTSVIRPDAKVLVLLMILAGWPAPARVVRSIALQERAKDYVKAAYTIGASRFRIARKYVAPGVIPAVLALAPIQMSIMIVLESTLSFLGMGIQPPTPTWGGIMLDGKNYLTSAWWLTTLPGLAIFVTALSLMLIGDGLQRLTGQRVDIVDGAAPTLYAGRTP